MSCSEAIADTTDAVRRGQLDPFLDMLLKLAKSLVKAIESRKNKLAEIRTPSKI